MAGNGPHDVCEIGCPQGHYIDKTQTKAQKHENNLADQLSIEIDPEKSAPRMPFFPKQPARAIAIHLEQEANP